MYQRFAITTFVLHLFLLICTAYICVKGTEVNFITASYIIKKENKDIEAFLPVEEPKEELINEYITFNEEDSGQNSEIFYSVLQRKYCISLSETDLETFYKIVEAEAGCEDRIGKLLVANVIINRVKSSHFPNTVQEVVYQQEGGVSQFSPISNGRMNQVQASEDTKKIVQDALMGEDVSEGALYFACRSVADPERMKWFDTHLTFLFRHDGHEFFL